MAQASRDENRVPTLLGVSSIDNLTPTTAAVDPTTHEVLVKDGAITNGTQKTQIVDSAGHIVAAEMHGGQYHLLTDSLDINKTGTLGALDATVEMDTHGEGSALILVSGTWTGKIIFEGSIDSTWVNLSMVQPGGAITFNGIQNDNQNGLYRVLIIAAYSKLRARMSQYTIGSATVEINASKPVGTSYSWQLVASNLQTTSNQTTAANLQMTANQTTAANLQATARLVDNYGFTVENTPMDEMRVVNPVRLVGASFQNEGNAGAVDTNFWTATPTSGGAAVQANGQVTLSTNTTANAAISLQSQRRARYLGGSSNRFRASIRLGDTGTTNNVRRWGIFDSTNGAYFKISGTTISACTIKAGSETAVSSASWNGSTTVPTLTSNQTYEIYITNKNVYFVISGILVHTATFNTTTWTDTSDLPIRVDNTNSGGSTANVTIEVRVATIYRLGNLSTQPISAFQSGTTAGRVLKYGAGNLHGLVVSGVVNNSDIILYDNTAASGTILWESGAMGAQTQPFPLDMHEIPFSNGLTLVISGANSNVFIAYE